jgi:phosphoribosyl-AMP cyclohydrolase
MPESPPRFAPRGDLHAVETGTAFAPKFDRDGLIVAVVADASSGDVLMVAWMNAEALARTIATGEGWFWSRSRGALWRKGDTSGNRLTVRELRIDCDQDTLLVKAEISGEGAACHLGYRSCFYRSVPLGGTEPAEIVLRFDPEAPAAAATKLPVDGD